MPNKHGPLGKRTKGPKSTAGRRTATGRKSPATPSRNRPFQPGRPHKGAEITTEEYAAALMATGADYNATAEMLGCSAVAVSNKVKNHPELQNIRDNRRTMRIEKAISILEWALSEENDDRGLKFNAAKYELDRQSDEFKKSVDVDATVGVRKLPDITVEFVEPGEQE